MSPSEQQVAQEAAAVDLELEETDSGSDDDLIPNPNHETTFSDLPVLRLISYGHSRGPIVPTPAVVFDIRTLPNPPKHVRSSQTGLNKPLRDWFFADEDVQKRFDEACGVIEEKLKQVDTEEDDEVVVGVCCQLGKHRSVAFVEELGKRKWEGWQAVVEHRDVHIKRSGSERNRRGQVAPGDDD